MTDEEIMAALTEIAPDNYDLALRAVAEGAARDGNNITAFVAPALVTRPAVAPMVIVVHVAKRPSMAAIRTAFMDMRRRCDRENE